MMKIKGENLPNIPWESKPKNCDDVVWRSSKNPIIPRDAVKCANSIFNSAIVPFESEFRGVFRIDHRTRRQWLHAASSKNGIDWVIDEEPIQFECNIPEIAKFEYGYDPRVCKIEDKYYVTWCNGYHGPTIGAAYTTDFKTFHQLENAFLPFNRNGVMFPRKINENFAIISRPSDPGHTPFGAVFYSESPDMIYWGKHRHVMSPAGGWQSLKVGGGPIPIETDEGWLIIYHGVLNSCNGFVYSAGAALLDLEQPWKVLYRTEPYILAPWESYECFGDVPNVVFPCSSLCDAESGRIAIYYGAADTTICMAYTYANDLVEFIKKNSMI